MKRKKDRKRKKEDCNT